MDEAKQIKRRLKRNKYKIRRWINVPELLPHLRSRGLVGNEERAKLLELHRRRKKQKIFKFLCKTLSKRGTKAFIDFRDCLQAEEKHLGHRCAAELLKGSYCAEEEGKRCELIEEAVRQCEPTIQKYLGLVEILPFLRKHSLLMDDEYSILVDARRGDVRSERIQELLSILDTKGPHSASLFVKCLEEEESHSGNIELHQHLTTVIHQKEESSIVKSAAASVEHLVCTIPIAGLPCRLGLEGQLANKEFTSDMQKLQKCRYMGEWEDFKQGIDQLTRSDYLDVRTMGKLHQAVASIMEGKTELSLQLVVEAERVCDRLYGNNRDIMAGQCLYIRSAVYRHHQEYDKALQYLQAAEQKLANVLPGEDSASLYYHMGTLALDSIQRRRDSDIQAINAAKEDAERKFIKAFEHAECEDSGLPLIGWHSRVFLVLLWLGSSHHGVGRIAPSPQDLEKAESMLQIIYPKDLPWRTSALYHIASSDICRWKGDLSTALEHSMYGLGVAEAHRFAFEKRFAMNRVQDLKPRLKI